MRNSKWVQTNSPFSPMSHSNSSRRWCHLGMWAWTKSQVHSLVIPQHPQSLDVDVRRYVLTHSNYSLLMNPWSRNLSNSFFEFAHTVYLYSLLWRQILDIQNPLCKKELSLSFKAVSYLFHWTICSGISEFDPYHTPAQLFYCIDFATLNHI